MAAQRVKITTDGIDVRNFFGSRFIPWPDIGQLKLGRFLMLPAVCIVVLRDGSTYHASAIQPPNLTRARPENEATKLVDALNKRLAEYTSVTVNT